MKRLSEKIHMSSQQGVYALMALLFVCVLGAVAQRVCGDDGCPYATLSRRRADAHARLATLATCEASTGAEVCLQLAQAYAACGRWHDAQQILSAALGVYESDDLAAAFHWQRCEIRARLLDIDGAAAEAAQCVAHAPFAYPLAYHWRACAAWQRGHVREAVALWLDGVRVARPAAVAAYLDALAPFLVCFSTEDTAAYYDALLALLERPEPDSVDGLGRVLRELVKMEHIYPEMFVPHDTVALLAALPPRELPPERVLAAWRTNLPLQLPACVFHTCAVDEVLTRHLARLRSAHQSNNAVVDSRGELAALTTTVTTLSAAHDRIDGVLPRTLVAHLYAQAEVQARNYSPLTRSQALERVSAERAFLAQHISTHADVDYLTWLHSDEMLLQALLGNAAAAERAWERVQALSPRSARFPVPPRHPAAGAPGKELDDTAPLFDVIHAVTNRARAGEHATAALARLVQHDDLLGAFTARTNADQRAAALAGALLRACAYLPLDLTVPSGEAREPVTGWQTIFDYLMRSTTTEAIAADEALRTAAAQMAARWALAVPASGRVEHTSLLKRLLSWRRTLQHAGYEPMQVLLVCDARHWPPECAPVLITDSTPAPSIMQPHGVHGVWQARLVFPAGAGHIKLAIVTNVNSAGAGMWQRTIRRGDAAGDPLAVHVTAPRLRPVQLVLACDLRHAHGVQSVHVLGSHPALGAWVPTCAARLTDDGRDGDQTAHDGIWSGTFTCAPEVQDVRFIVLAAPLNPEQSYHRTGFIRRYSIPETSAPTATYSFTYGFVMP